MVLGVMTVLCGVSCSNLHKADMSASELDPWYEIAEHIRGTDNIPLKGLMFLYAGPFAWSEPEWRIVVDFHDDYETEVIRLEEHSSFQASRMFDEGVSDIRELKKGLKMHRVVTNGSACGDIYMMVSDVWRKVQLISTDFDYPEDDGLHRLMVDGGSSNTIWLSNGEYQTLSFSTVDDHHEIVRMIEKFEDYIYQCVEQNNSSD